MSETPGQQEQQPNTKRQDAEDYHTKVARTLVRMANGSLDVDHGLESILFQTLKFRQRLNSGSGIVHPEERVQLVGQAFEDIISGRDTGRIPTGLPCLDNVLLGGLAPGTVTVIAGATGSGKSVALQQIAEHSAKQDKRVLLVAVEMDAVQLSYRSIARATGIEKSKITRGRLDPTQTEIVKLEIENFARLPIHYKDGGSMSTSGIYEAVLEIQKDFGSVDMIVADYMQILEDEQGGANENLRLTGISRALVQLGREFRCPILVGSQLSRECVKRGRRPTPQDLRESGSIENDATTVILLHSEYDPDSGAPQEDIEPITWIVGKNRNGLQNVDIHTNFFKPQQRFMELPAKQQGIAGDGLTTEQVNSNLPNLTDLEQF